MRLLVVLLACGACGDDGGATDAQSPACIGLADTREVHALAKTYGAADGAFPGDLCVEGHPELPCARTTDASGAFTLCVPSTGDLGIHMKQSGFEPALYLVGAGSVPADAVLLAGDDETVKQRYYDPLAATYPPKFGTNIVFTLVDDAGPLTNANITLTPNPNKPVAFLDASSMLDQSLQATSASGRAIVAEAAPNSYAVEVKVGATVRTCTNDLGGGNSPFTAVGGRDVNVILHCAP